MTTVDQLCCVIVHFIPLCPGVVIFFFLFRFRTYSIVNPIHGVAIVVVEYATGVAINSFSGANNATGTTEPSPSLVVVVVVVAASSFSSSHSSSSTISFLFWDRVIVLTVGGTSRATAEASYGWGSSATTFLVFLFFF